MTNLTPGPSLATATTRTVSAEVRLFDTFAVLRPDGDVTPPPGRPSTLIKVLAVHGGWITIDMAIDVLWNDVSLATGRRRLRNVLYRVRTVCGELIDRNGETLFFAPDTGIDLCQWRERSATDCPVERRALVEHAPDEFLRSDRYEDWLEPHRRDYQLDLLGLIDRVARDAEAVGDIDGATRMLLRAFRLDPMGNDRLTRAIRILEAAGRDGEASDLRRWWPGQRWIEQG